VLPVIDWTASAALRVHEMAPFAAMTPQRMQSVAFRWSSLALLVLALAASALGEQRQDTPPGHDDGPRALMRREMDVDVEEAKHRIMSLNTVSARAAALERLDQSMATRIVYESLQQTKLQPQVTAQLERKAPRPRDLKQVCMLTNPQSDPTTFLASREWHEQVREGENFARSKRIVFAGLWREIGSSAASEIFNVLMALGSFFRDYQLIMLENDSKDDTVVGITRSCASVERAWCFTLTGLGKEVLHARAPNRIVGLTALRQTLLMKVMEFDHSGIFDYVMMVDADIYAQGNGGFDIASTLAAFSLPQRMSADAVCALQVAGRTSRYYDTFAHRGPECTYANMQSSTTCPAQSCGGGLVFYSLPAIRESHCNYTYVGETTCEHVPFNQCLARGGHGRIFLFKPWAIAMADQKGTRSDWSCTLL
jgi:hypothetical protein